jgi:hypothetical protein
MMDDRVSAELMGCFHDVRQRIEDCAIDVSLAMTAPHILYKAALSKDGNQWCWLYGSNLQEGVAGFGDTPALAAKAFDAEWNKP